MEPNTVTSSSATHYANVDGMTIANLWMAIIKLQARVADLEARLGPGVGSMPLDDYLAAERRRVQEGT